MSERDGIRTGGSQGRGGLGRMRRWVWIAGGALGLVVCLAAAAAWWVTFALSPPARTGKAIAIEIRPGETPAQVAQDLARAGVIRNAQVFRWYAQWTHLAQRFQAGHYVFRPGQSAREVARQLAEGRVAIDVVAVTIPEGFTVRQIAQRLQEYGVCSAAAFVQAVQHGRFREPFVGQLPHDPRIKYRLEGYLFPDTYQFVRGEPAHDVVDEMLQNFARRVLQPPLLRAMKRRHLSLPAAITEASIVEREAKVASERPLIASVIDNRLHHRPPMKLQMDATVEYILGHRDALTDTDLKVNDPYNTYLHDGLPPGPIANPGLASIEAVLHPAQTNYLYYVVKNDGSGKDYFATTYAEQLKNEARSQENLRRHQAAHR